MLEFRNLRAGYDGAEKLHGITARLEPGRLTAIIGPNGCGKSTLLKCCAGLLKPMGGEVLLNAAGLHSIPDKERARCISYMPQSRIAPDISVRRLVTHGRYPHLAWGQRPSKADKELVEEAIGRVRLTEYASKPVSRLSGGERQRAYLAMMLAQQTPVMLLDEPTTYLDMSAQFALMELLRSICREGHGAAVVLHDLPLALEYADRILLMQHGQLIAEGTPDEVFASGMLQQVFGVEAKRMSAGKYIFSQRTREETV